MLDERGLAGFTMRSLAERLGTYPATVYWHVGNRDQLLVALVDRVLAGMNVPDASRMGWQDWLASLAREYRRVMHRHPNVAGLAASQLLVSPPAMRLVEAVLGVLAGAGLKGQVLAGAYNAYVGSVVGWVSVELCAVPANSHQDWQDNFAQSVRSVRAEEYPVIAANLDHLAGTSIALRWQAGSQRPMDAAAERDADAGPAAPRRGAALPDRALTYGN